MEKERAWRHASWGLAGHLSSVASPSNSSISSLRLPAVRCTAWAHFSVNSLLLSGQSWVVLQTTEMLGTFLPAFYMAANSVWRSIHSRHVGLLVFTWIAILMMKCWLSEAAESTKTLFITAVWIIPVKLRCPHNNASTVTYSQWRKLRL